MSKILPLSKLLRAEPKDQDREIKKFSREIRDVKNKSSCNRMLAAGVAGEAWKVCEECKDGTCTTCSNCLVVKFPVDEKFPIPEDEVYSHDYILKRSIGAKYAVPLRHVYQLIRSMKTPTSIIPFTELINPDRISSTIQISDVHSLIKEWIRDHSLIKPSEWRSINLQLFATLASIQSVIKNFHHNDCHSKNVMITDWVDGPQKYKGRKFTLLLSPQRFCVKLIDFGQVTSDDPSCSTKEGRLIWSDWNVPLLDLARFSFDIMTDIFDSKVPPELIEWTKFILKYLGSDIVVTTPPDNELDRLWGLSSKIRSLGISEESVREAKFTMADLLDDEYFDIFRI